ncbi:Uncharacterised protein [Lacrimispora sphenoides]|uniref:Transporter n=2 Tax=Lacrimispora TaxID=2719231 RepID=A0ABY1CJ50_9FIRM|nr:hypothetical protein SAMN02745906_4765 [[Clostridium] sphenoides JCM 1415]SUY49329.1 Uncharacterised protein [Lacrimispora sphenoides]
MTNYPPPYGAPTSPPPRVPPRKPRNSYMIDCMFKYTYVWPQLGDEFWYYPISLQYGAVLGYRWTGRSWTFFGFDPDLIDEVACVPVPTLY